MIGSTNNPQTDRGTVASPFMVERPMPITGGTLEIYYTPSTWNPDIVARMR